MEEQKMMEIEVNAFQLVIHKPIPEVKSVTDMMRNDVISLMPSPTFIIRNDHHAEQILRGFVHSGFEVSIKEIKIKEMVPEKRYHDEACCSECVSTSVAPRGY